MFGPQCSEVWDCIYKRNMYLFCFQSMHLQIKIQNITLMVAWFQNKILRKYDFKIQRLCVLLRAFVRFCVLLRASAPYCALLRTFVYFCTLLCAFVPFCAVFNAFVCLCMPLDFCLLICTFKVPKDYKMANNHFEDGQFNLKPFNSKAFNMKVQTYNHMSPYRVLQKKRTP